MAKDNPLKELGKYGQYFWLDYIRRTLLTSAEFQKMLDEDGLSGMTSNPTIFEKAIAHSDDYDQQFQQLVDAGKDDNTIYEALTTEDIKHAADKLRPAYDKSEGRTGYVSYEVSPLLANDTAQTVKYAHKYFEMINRPNLMIKVPSTPPGIPAIQQLISEGHNINITLMFSMNHYNTVAEAYVKGLEARAAKGQPVDRIGSVASFFVSRVETLVDKKIDSKLASKPDEALKALKGTAAVANARVVYQRYKEIFEGPRFAELRKKGARPQMVLWASTSTKNPAYPDTKYVDDLIGGNTVNTMPPETVDAYRNHGHPGANLEKNVDQARDVIARLKAAGIDLLDVGEELQRDGVESFDKSFVDLMNAIKIRHEKGKAAAQAHVKK